MHLLHDDGPAASDLQRGVEQGRARVNSTVLQRAHADRSLDFAAAAPTALRMTLAVSSCSQQLSMGTTRRP